MAMLQAHHHTCVHGPSQSSNSFFGKIFVRPAPLHQVADRRPGTVRPLAARLGGVDIPNQKRIETSLQYIYGIGLVRAKEILEATSIENKRTRELTEEELTALRQQVDNYTIEGDLRRETSQNIQRLVQIQCHRGKRHQRSLPCRGQRTKNNSRTAKNRRKKT